MDRALAMPPWERVWSSSSLPTLPAIALRLLELSRSPVVETEQLIEVINADPALTGRILRAANAASFGFRSKITSIDRAAVVIGSNLLLSLAMGFCVVDEAMDSGPLANHYRDYWAHSIVQATAAQALSASGYAKAPGECFQTGLLLDIGRLALLKTLGAEYAQAVTQAKDAHQHLVEAEKSLLGFHHAEVGCRLARTWELPNELQMAIAHHHDEPDEIHRLRQGEGFRLAWIAAMAAAVGDYICTEHKGCSLQRMEELTAYMVMSEEEMGWLLQQIRDKVEESGELFRIQTDRLPSAQELMAEANAQLCELTRAHLERNELTVKSRTLREAASRDFLTGIYNRRYFCELIERESRKGPCEGQLTGVLFIDIDHFKRLNDTLGHAAGDEALRVAAGILAQNLRGADIVARYGGEEFVVLLRNTTPNMLAAIAERLRAAIESAVIVVAEMRVSVTVSVGGALGGALSGDTDLVRRLIETADQAMYEAKRNGRNQVCVRSIPGALAPPGAMSPGVMIQGTER